MQRYDRVLREVFETGTISDEALAELQSPLGELPLGAALRTYDNVSATIAAARGANSESRGVGHDRNK